MHKCSRENEHAEVGKDTNNTHTHWHTYTQGFSQPLKLRQCWWGISAVPLNFKQSLLSGNRSFITFEYYMNTSHFKSDHLLFPPQLFFSILCSSLLLRLPFHLRLTPPLLTSVRCLVVAPGELTWDMLPVKHVSLFLKCLVLFLTL